MAGAAALFRHEREDAAVVEAGGVGRREVARGDDMFLGRLTDAFRLGAEQLVEYAAGHVTDVRRPLAQEVVVHLLEDLDVTLGDLLETELDVEAGAPDLLADVVDEGDVLEHEQVGVEDGGLGLVQLAGDVVAELRDLQPGGREGPFKTADFGLRIGHLLAGDDGHAPHQRVSGTTGDTRGGGDAYEAYLGPVFFGLHPCIN